MPWLQMSVVKRVSCGKCWLQKKWGEKDKCLFFQQGIHCIDMQDLDRQNTRKGQKKKTS